MHSNRLFDLPIYKDSPEEYGEYLKAEHDKKVTRALAVQRGMGRDTDDEELRRLIEALHELNPGKIAWKYNRIIGWIVFYADCLSLKAELWFIRSRRITNNLARRVYDYRNKISDVSVTHSLSNDQIVEDIERFLDNLQNGGFGKEKLRKYYIDKDDFLRNLRHTDIKGLLRDIASKDA